MSRYYGGWAPYVSVADRRKQASREAAKLRKKGQSVEPVILSGKKIATTFWGLAWCDNIESYHDAENRLPRGRSYVRNGLVVDLQVLPGRITAVVSGSELYKVTITIKEMAAPPWRAICMDCAGGIDSLVELLQGRFSKGVMERLCRQQGGLFPCRSEIRFSCSCPDGASMCKHVAATLYGVGARLDAKPELLFRLRTVDEKDLITGIDAAGPLGRMGPGTGRVLETDDMSALFGIDMAEPEAPVAAAPGLAKAVPKAKAPSSVQAKPPRGTTRPRPATTLVLKPAAAKTSIPSPAKRSAATSKLPKVAPLRPVPAETARQGRAVTKQRSRER